MVRDLDVRLALYRRISTLETPEEMDDLADELVDRFGGGAARGQKPPGYRRHQGMCRTAGVRKVDSGPRGASVAFKDDQFANPAGLVDFIAEQQGMINFGPIIAWSRPVCGMTSTNAWPARAL